MALLAARVAGAGRVFVTDLSEIRLAMAKRQGADAVLNPDGVRLGEALTELTDGAGVDLVIDAAGSPITIQQGVELVRRGGKIVWIGLPGEDPVAISVHQVIDKELDLLGIFRYANVYADAVRLVASGQISLKPLVTHRFPLAETAEALLTAGRRGDSAVKVLVEV